MHVIWQRAERDAAELVAGGGIENQGFAVFGFVCLLHGGDGEAIGAHGHGVDFFIAAGGDLGNLGGVGGIGGIQDIHLARLRVHRENALGGGVVGHDFRC